MTMTTLDQLVVLGGDPSAISNDMLEPYLSRGFADRVQGLQEQFQGLFRAAFDAAYNASPEARAMASHAQTVYSRRFAELAPTPHRVDLVKHDELARGERDQLRCLLAGTFYLRQLVEYANKGVPTQRWQMPVMPAGEPLPYRTKPDYADDFSIAGWCAIRPELLDTRRTRVIDGSLRVNGYPPADMAIMRKHARSVLAYIDAQFEPVSGNPALGYVQAA
jgi:hypothetical protein